jgi:beige protein homolog 1
MDLPVRRHRSSTAASRPYNPVSSPTITELRALIEVLNNASSTRSERPSSDLLQSQSTTLRRIRQLLIESSESILLKDTFRHVHGFVALLQTLRSVSSFYNTGKCTGEEVSAFLELLKTGLDVLAAALVEHPGNRRYFAKRVEGGGWKALEQALGSTGIFDNESKSPQDEKTKESFFGCLFAFALGDDAIAELFRNLSEDSDVGKEITAGVQSSMTTDGPTALDPLETEVRKRLEHWQAVLKSRLTANERLRNPDIMPLILSFWHLLSSDDGSQLESGPLSASVLLAIKEIAALSTYNKVALHLTGILSIILPMTFDDSRPYTETLILKDLSSLLIDFGLNKLEDAYRLIREAGYSEDAADFLLYALQNSRGPAFIQFDLSLHGCSSIELADLGRPFPPTGSAGYTIMTWIRIDSYDTNCHTTIFGAFDSSHSCFVLAYIEQGTKHFILQTSTSSQKPSVRFRSVAFDENIWYHVAIVHRRPKALSPSKAALFVNGEFAEQVRCPYPSSPPMPAPPRPSSSTDSFASLSSSSVKYAPVQAFLGTPQNLSPRLGSDVVFSKISIASFHLFQDALPDELIAVYQKLGPRYSGNYQDCLGSFQTYKASAQLNLYNELLHPGKDEESIIRKAVREKAGRILPEFTILFSVSPLSVMDDDDRNAVDESQLIKSLSKDAARNLQHFTRIEGNPVVINGAIPSINDALTQMRGVALLKGEPVVVVPQSLDEATWRIGGCAAICLRLVEQARTKKSILRAVTILFECIEDNWRNSEALEKESAFAILAGLLREKLGFGSITPQSGTRRATLIEGSDRDQLTLDILKVILKYVGYNENNPTDSVIINPLAYRVLLVDNDMWRKSSLDTQFLYYDQFFHLAQDSKHHHFSQKRLTRMRKYRISVPFALRLTVSGVIKRMLDALKGETMPDGVFPKFSSAFKALFRCSFSQENLRSLALFITFALQDGRTHIKRGLSTKKSMARISSQRASTPLSNSASGTPRSGSPHEDLGATPNISRHEVGVKMLDLYTELLCEKGNEHDIKRFGKTVTNKVCDNYASQLLQDVLTFN